MKTKEELPECPVATTVSLIGNKWKLLILRNLLVRPWRFNELHRNLEGISQKVLTESLRQMEADGIITRTVFPKSRRAWNTRYPNSARACARSSIQCRNGVTIIKHRWKNNDKIRNSKIVN